MHSTPPDAHLDESPDDRPHGSAGGPSAARSAAVELEPGEFDTVAVTEAKDRSPAIVLLSTSLAVFAVFLDTTVGFVTFPAISATFAASGPSTVSWVLNAYTLVFAALLIPAGRLADRVGRRKLFLIGVVIFTTGSVLCGLAPTIGFLIAAEMLEAVGAAMLVPASLALVLQSFPRSKVPVAVAIWGAIGAVAGAAGPALGALIVSSLGWRWAFYMNVPVGLVSFGLGRLVLPEGREAHPGRLPDPAGVVVLMAGIGLVTYAIVETTSWGWTSATFAVTLTIGLALVGLFVWRCGRVTNPVIHLALFRARNFRWAGAATAVFAVGFTASFLTWVLFLTEVWGYTILRAGLSIAAGPTIVAVTAPFFGRLAGRYGQRRLLVPGGLIWAAGPAWLLLRATSTPDFGAVFLPSLVITAFGVALCLPQLSSAAVQGLPADQFAAGSAVVQAVRYLGSTLGVAIVVAVTAGAAFDSFRQVWWLVAGCGITVSVLASRLLTPGRSAGDPPAVSPSSTSSAPAEPAVV